MNDADLDDFRRVGGDALAWIAEYLRTIRARNVLPATAPGDLRAVLPKSAPEDGERGVFSRMTLYASEEAPSSVEKGALLLGIGRSNVRRVPIDAALRMRPDALRDAILQARRDGFVPFCVLATAGTTNSDA